MPGSGDERCARVGTVAQVLQHEAFESLLLTVQLALLSFARPEFNTTDGPSPSSSSWVQRGRLQVNLGVLEAAVKNGRQESGGVLGVPRKIGVTGKVPRKAAGRDMSKVVRSRKKMVIRGVESDAVKRLEAHPAEDVEMDLNGHTRR